METWRFGTRLPRRYLSPLCFVCVELLAVGISLSVSLITLSVKHTLTHTHTQPSMSWQTVCRWLDLHAVGVCLSLIWLPWLPDSAAALGSSSPPRNLSSFIKKRVLTRFSKTWVRKVHCITDAEGNLTMVHFHWRNLSRTFQSSWVSTGGATTDCICDVVLGTLSSEACEATQSQCIFK